MLALVVTVGPVAGCGADEVEGYTGSATSVGVDGGNGEVELRDAYVAVPPAGGFRPGDVAAVAFTLIATGPEPDALIRVESGAGPVRLRWDRRCDGVAEVVSQLPLPLLAPQPEPGAFPSRVGYRAEIDLDRPLAGGGRVPVTFRFARSRAVTVAMPVARRLHPEDTRTVCPRPPG